MKVAALLMLLVVLPGRAGEPAPPTQARLNVVGAMGLPREVSERAEKATDLQGYLAKLPPEQRVAALRSLTAEAGELGKDPATLSLMGQAYAGLGKVKEARLAAEQVLRVRENDPEARRVLLWADSQDRLAGRDGAPGGTGDGPAATKTAALAAGRHANLNDLEQRLQGVFRRGQGTNAVKGSDEFKRTLRDAGGMSVAELQEAGIAFQRAPTDQKDAVQISQQDGKFTISIRDDALSSGGENKDARGAAHVANGVRQAQTLRDHEYIGWALIKARGWISGARTHRELAAGDIEANPSNPSDANLMAQRKLLSIKEDPLPSQPSTYGDTNTNNYMLMMGAIGGTKTLEELFQNFINSTKRGGGPG